MMVNLILEYVNFFQKDSFILIYYNRRVFIYLDFFFIKYDYGIICIKFK